jgi:hypothetical protein
MGGGALYALRHAAAEHRELCDRSAAADREDRHTVQGASRGLLLVKVIGIATIILSSRAGLKHRSDLLDFTL